MGGRDEQVESVKAALRSTSLRATDWERKIISCWFGNVAPEDFLAGELTHGQRCEAYYYLGSKAFISGDRTGALQRFKQCIQTNFHGHYEYDLARWHDARIVRTRATIP